MLSGGKLSLEDFVYNGRFDLNTYLNYLFHHCKGNYPDSLKNGIIKIEGN